MATAAQRKMTLTQRLLLGFLTVTIIPVVGGAGAGVIAFGRSIDRQGLRTVEAQIERAHAAVDLRSQGQAQLLETTALDSGVRTAVAARDTQALDIKLSSLVAGDSSAYTLAYDVDGRVLAGSRGVSPLNRPAYVPFREALRGETTVGWDLVPLEEIEALGLADTVAIEVKETPKGTVINPELDTVLSLIAFAPVTDEAGAVIGVLASVDPIARSSSLVDQIVGKSDAKVTVFQHEVRVATTVTDAENRKAYGTVVSDPVRAKTLEDKQPFRGEAEVVGTAMYTAYDPIRSPVGETIGMLFVGIPLAPLMQDRKEFLWLLTGAFAASLAVAGIWATVVSRRVAAPLASLSEAAGHIAAGELGVSAPLAGSRETYDLGDAFNHMTGALAGIITRAKSTTAVLRSATDDITSAARTQAEGASRQASAVSETTATLEEMAATYRSVSQSADRVLQLAEDALEAAEDGHRHLDTTIEGVVGVRTESERTREAAEQLAESASDIAEVLGIIDAIAAQTKILALNAAIEAARAGEAGKGFAVVATEIRALAESVIDSTAHIERLLDTIKDGSTSLARAAGTQEAQVSEAVERGGRTEAAFTEIVDKMAATASAAREIATAADQQKTASEQVVQAMHQVSLSTQETAAAAHQVNGAADRLVEHSADLDESLRGFRIG